MAPDRRGGHRGLRAGDRAGAGAHHASGGGGEAQRPGPHRRRSEAARPAPAVTGADARREPWPRPASRAKGGGRGRGRPGTGAHRAGRSPHRGGPGRHQHHRLGLEVGADRLRPDGRGDVRPRRLVGRDRPGRSARPSRAPPRRHLGDDDRRAHVGDPAGPPRRAGEGDGPLPARRPDARDLPGPDRHARLADRAQHPRPGPAGRDHRLDDRPLPGEHPEALPGLDRRRCSSCSRC